MRRTWARRVRLHSNFSHGTSSPTFVPLILFRGLAGIAFLCFGELFWMHLSRIGLEEEGKLLGSMALILGAGMVVGALFGAAGISFSADDGGHCPLLTSVYISAPLSLVDLVAALTFAVKRSQVLQEDRQHEENHGGRPRPGPPGPGPEPEDDPQSQAASFQRLYDVFLFLSLAFSVLEALMFRLGRRRLAAAAAKRREQGPRSFLSGGALESLLDEEDGESEGWEEWRGGSMQQSLFMEQRYEQLRRASIARNEGLLEHARGGGRNHL